MSKHYHVVAGNIPSEKGNIVIEYNDAVRTKESAKAILREYREDALALAAEYTPEQKYRVVSMLDKGIVRSTEGGNFYPAFMACILTCTHNNCGVYL